MLLTLPEALEQAWKQLNPKAAHLASLTMTKELLQAIENDDVQKVREILAAGVDVNFINDDGEFPLAISCWRGNKEIV